ncbi:MAG: hypothetical protein OSA84_11630 [Akkermansiaceae bacterium]|nr:hypothetical protein [Akkermansiaceae bacterium]
MGSPYLNAHGLGKPVTDATTEIDVPEDGEYRVWVRTIDWTKRLGRPESARPSKTTAAMIILGKAEGKVTLATSDFCRETSSFRQVPTFYAAFSLSAFQLYPIPLSSTLRSGQRLFQEPPVKANS